MSKNSLPRKKKKQLKKLWAAIKGLSVPCPPAEQPTFVLGTEGFKLIMKENWFNNRDI